MKSRRPIQPRRFCAATCLLVFALGCSGLLPDILATAAYLDGSHEVHLNCHDGSFQLVLHHPEAGSRDSATARCEHRHGWAAQVLCVLSESKDFDPDHILQGLSGFLVEPDAGIAMGTLVQHPAPPSWLSGATCFDGRWSDPHDPISPHHLAKGWSPPLSGIYPASVVVLLI